MPSKTSKKAAATQLPSLPKELIDQLVTGPMTAEAVNAASMSFKKVLIERDLGAEPSHHLGYPPGAERPADADNHRNGTSGKTILTEDGPPRIDVPCDRHGRFASILIPWHERRFTGFDDKIVEGLLMGGHLHMCISIPPNGTRCRMLSGISRGRARFRSRANLVGDRRTSAASTSGPEAASSPRPDWMNTWFGRTSATRKARTIGTIR